MNKYRLHPGAYLDIDGVWDFIAEDNIDAADGLRERIFKSIRNLAIFPHQGHWRTDIASKRFRFQGVGKYLIAYVPDAKPLLVLAVVQGSRHPRTIAAILRSRDTLH